MAVRCDGEQINDDGMWTPVITLAGVVVWRDRVPRAARHQASICAQGHLAKVLRRILLEG